MNSKVIKFHITAAPEFASRSIFALLLSLAILTSCGGGGASTASTENNLPSPVAGGIKDGALVPSPTGESPTPAAELITLPQVSVGPRQYADPNVLLTLSGTAVAAKGS